MFNSITKNLKYIEYLKRIDNNYKTLSNELDNIWQILLDNYIVLQEDVSHVQFKSLFNIKDDSSIYRNFISNANKSEVVINYLIRVGFVEKSIVRVDTFLNFESIALKIPETIVFTEDYLAQINKDWQDIEKLINDLNASLIYYGLKRKDNING